MLRPNEDFINKFWVKNGIEKRFLPSAEDIKNKYKNLPKDIILNENLNLINQKMNKEIENNKKQSSYDGKTAIYYVNTNNGYTKFEDGTVVNSVENRCVVFDSSLRHTGTTCTDQKTRVVINFCYVEGNFD